MSSIHALIVDDNAQNVRVLVQLLVKQGVRSTQVEKSTNLESLLPTLEPVDLVFLDLEMPGLNGFEAKDLLRSHLGDTPIIAYTVHLSEMGTARDMGFDGFLGKPLDTTRFPEQLARILNGEPVWERA